MKVRVITMTILIVGFTSSTVTSSNVDDNYRILGLILSNETKSYQKRVHDLMCVNLRVLDM